jgi:hypothetical protein
MNLARTGALVGTLALALSIPAIAQENAADARRHVEFLAADALEGRATGTAGAAAAAEYLVTQLESLGAMPLPGADSFRLPFEFTAAVTDAGSRLAGVRRNWNDADSIQALAFSEDGALEGTPVVFAGYGITAPEAANYPYDSYASLNVEGKIVVVLDGYPQDTDEEGRRALSGLSDTRFKAFLARSKGAKAILIASGPHSPGDGIVTAPRAGMAASGSGIMAARIGRDVATAIFQAAGHDLAAAQAEMDTGNPHAAGFDLGVELWLDTKLARDRRAGYNVVGYLPADTPTTEKPFVFLGAHYDHLGRGQGGGSLAGASDANAIHNGADDNASGVAAVLLAGARLAAMPRDRHVVLGFWSGEEIGIVGSTAFLTSEGLPAGDIAAYINFDMVGRSQDNKLSVQGVGSSAEWRPIIERSNFPVGFDLTLTDDPNLPTDSTAFNLAEVPTLALFTGSHVDYHKPSDDAELINYEDLARVAQFGALLASRVANAEAAPEFVAYQSETRRASRGGSRVFTGTIPDYASDITGLLLGGVIEGGPAEEAGLAAGDVITSFGGQEVTDIYDYMYALEAARIGEPLEVVYVRDGETHTTTLTPRARE